MSEFTSITQVKVLPHWRHLQQVITLLFQKGHGSWNTEHFMTAPKSDRLQKQNTFAKYF